jgi:hypothetical protein
VTNSRDTQEIPFYEGTQMLEIFRDYQEDTSILNDFDIFEKPIRKSNFKKNKKAPFSPTLLYQSNQNAHQVVLPRH